jgi:hypothetical protein
LIARMMARLRHRLKVWKADHAPIGEGCEFRFAIPDSAGECPYALRRPAAKKRVDEAIGSLTKFLMEHPNCILSRDAAAQRSDREVRAA